MVAPPGSGAVDTRATLLPLWRGMVAFRVVTLLYAGVAVARSTSAYARPAVALGIVAVMAAWTAYTSVRYLRGTRRLAAVAVADLGVTVVTTLGTLVVETPERLAAGAPVITSAWSVGPVLAVAILLGARRGLAAAVVSSVALVVVRGRFDAQELSTVQLLVVVGLAVGLAATALRRSALRLQEAVAAEAATAERERLARGLHDGVLQVLSYVRRHGGELGLDGAELARLAGEQETSLRRLITTGPPRRRGAGDPVPPTLDLAAEIVAVLPTRAHLALPPGPVPAAGPTVTGLLEAVREAVTNADEHAGPDAGLWVLVEDEREAITVTVRDDGPGIPEGRLVEAAAGGHLGVASSIRGRLRDLGGYADLLTGPGTGTEWEMRVPRDDGAGRP